MANVTKDLGLATAYAYHKAGGGTLTEAEFEQKMVDITTAVDDAETAKDDAVAAKNAAEASAQNISQSAQQIATNTSDIADLKEDLNESLFVQNENITSMFVLNRSVTTNISIGATVDVENPKTSSNWGYAICKCRKGDTFTVTGKGGSNPRLWAFTDNTYVLISKSNASAVGSELSLTAPNDGYLIVNTETNRTYQLLHSHYYEKVKDNIDALDERIAPLEESVDVLNAVLDENDVDAWFIIKGYPDVPNIQSNTNTRTIYFPCVSGRRYTIDKELISRFRVYYCAEKPAIGALEYVQIGIYDNETSVNFVAPEGANYIMVYVYNSNTDSSSGTANDVLSSITVKYTTAKDYTLRSFAWEEGNNEDLWEIGSLGASGENYARNYEIRTKDYMPISAIEKISFSDVRNSLFCVYNESKKFVHRYSYSTITEIVPAKVIADYPSAYYFRFTVYTDDTTEQIDVSMSNDVSMKRNNLLYAVNAVGELKEFSDSVEHPNVLEIHKKDKQKAEILKIQRLTSENYGNASLRFLFFTDVHNEKNRMERCVDLINGWGGNYLNIAINGGDTVQYIGSEDLTWYNEQVSRCNFPVLNCVGNHDAYSSLGTKGSAIDAYNAIIAPVATNVQGIVQPSNAAENGLNYYYYDVSNARIIVLDYMYWTAEQNNWFIDVLSDARTNGMYVICIAHAQFGRDYETDVICNWTNKVATSASDGLDINAAIAVKEYMDAGGKFVAWIFGHSHGDAIRKLNSEYGNQFMFVFPAFVNRASTLHKSSNTYAYNYDCLTYLVLDTYNNVLKGMRIGANINNEGTEHNGFSIDFINGELISTW